jgi:carbon-monoxide dehydrogenase iron sulfur subunit
MPDSLRTTNPTEETREIFCRVDRCLGCRSCEIACALSHSLTGELVSTFQEHSLPVRRIRVHGLGVTSTFTRHRVIALQCRHCHEPLCVDVCIAGGVTKNEITGLVEFDSQRCVGCWSCTMVCPYGAVVRLSGSGIAVKCDRCDGQDALACVSACPTKALVFCTLAEFLQMTTAAE